jgi:hypothetical protein
MKKAHESRIELVTGISEQKKSHVLMYGANVGEHSSPLSFSQAAAALFPDRYPASEDPIELGMLNSASSERNSGFWTNEIENLQKQFSRRVKDRLSDGEIKHLSVFSLAPQPLLIQLGVLLGDIVECDVYQRHREPQTWSWPPESAEVSFRVAKPPRTKGKPALVLAISARVASERIVSVLGEEVSIWSITLEVPHNDVIKSRYQLSQLRTVLRRVFDEIKAIHGQTETLHVFTAAPVSACIELGRVRMPKADMPWLVYDQVNALGGFTSTVAIS